MHGKLQVQLTQSIRAKIDHVRWYGRNYKGRFAAAGFNVKKDDFVKNFLRNNCTYGA